MDFVYIYTFSDFSKPILKPYCANTYIHNRLELIKNACRPDISVICRVPKWFLRVAPKSIWSRAHARDCRIHAIAITVGAVMDVLGWRMGARADTRVVPRDRRHELFVCIYKSSCSRRRTERNLFNRSSFWNIDSYNDVNHDDNSPAHPFYQLITHIKRRTHFRENLRRTVRYVLLDLKLRDKLKWNWNWLWEWVRNTFLFDFELNQREILYMYFSLVELLIDEMRLSIGFSFKEWNAWNWNVYLRIKRAFY